MAKFSRVVVAGAVTGLVMVAFGNVVRSQQSAPAAAGVVPKSLDIPSLDLEAPLIKLGVTKSGEMELPPYSKPKVAGWYKGSAVPGDKGASVIVGHVDTQTEPAVFYKLRQLRKGSVVRVERSDGKTVEYKVTAIEQIDKDRFPAERVYEQDGLRLVTCGGRFDYDRHEYVDNVIVYASLVSDA
ncbi:class F sortase [Nonomuraea soli]|uniref:LPXTG-site transpeptidase (Sortase) family protein n=1 Tax=Nonomuraea soli TaxID=1032476 RepID=A0A7W0HVG2_9ACTN|nr:class F sortase [Nonomuraea soli]MBA2897219.1 LPXTG-site transpeptidase (sortase) family protein [Nonomuraea soli]